MKTILKQTYEKYWKDRLLTDLQKEKESLFPNEISESVAALLTNGERFLDIGCGQGNLIDSSRLKFDKIFGCDISETALRQAQSRGISGVCVDLNTSNNLPYQNESFDGIICLEVLEHIIDPLHLLYEIHRVLCSKGQLILSTPNIRYFRNLIKLILQGSFPHTTTDSFIWGGGHLHYFTMNDLSFLLKKAGFRKIAFHINQNQFARSWKRRLIFKITGNKFFNEFICGGIVAKAFKE